MVDRQQTDRGLNKGRCVSLRDVVNRIPEKEERGIAFLLEIDAIPV